MANLTLEFDMVYYIVVPNMGFFDSEEFLKIAFAINIGGMVVVKGMYKVGMAMSSQILPLSCPEVLNLLNIHRQL